MHGGMKVYAGAPAAARHYVEADRGRADDYYLAEGTGIARRFTTGPDGRAQELAPLSGDGYESWVAGLDPETGEPRGWLRTDDRAVRFVEVVVNGPKSWSMAAALHPNIAAAYDAAQDRAAGQVIHEWVGVESRYHQYSLASSPWLPSGPARPKIRSLMIASLPFHMASAKQKVWRSSQMPARPSSFHR